jgi:anaerobic magnesium-protoporphyrin IX monomethyl ester cyclase
MASRVLFVVYDNGAYDQIFPMGIGALTAILKKQGHEITIWHQDIHHYPDEYLTQYLDKNKFDIVFLSLIGGYYQYQKMKNLSKAINRSKQRPFYVMGGYGPTPEPEFFLKKSGCDVVCLGEGEVTISKLMDAFESKTPLDKVPGVAWLDNGKLKQTLRAPLVNNLDSLPMIPYEMFPMETYRMVRMPKASLTDFCFPMMSARGCTFKCTFCYRMDPGYRKRDPKELLDEVEKLHKDYGITRLTFMDDLLMSSVEHTEDVCREMLKRNLPITWDCMGRLNYTSKELLQLMKDSGCVYIVYGIESMDQKVLNNMKKGLRPDKIVSGIEQTLDVGISPGLNFIFGNRGDTRETLQKSVDFLLKYDDFAEKRTIRPVTPYPGSPLYYDAIESGLLDKNNPAEDFYERKHLNSDLLCCNFTELTDKEFYDALKLANRTLMKNYFDKQKNSTLKMIDHLYDNLDTSFRGFRHHGGKTDASLNAEDSFRTSDKKNGKEKLVNYENSLSRDADAARFSEDTSNGANDNKSLKSYDIYLKKKAITAKARSIVKKKPVNPKATSSLYTNWH